MGVATLRRRAARREARAARANRAAAVREQDLDELVRLARQEGRAEGWHEARRHLRRRMAAVATLVVLATGVGTAALLGLVRGRGLLAAICLLAVVAKQVHTYATDEDASAVHLAVTSGATIAVTVIEALAGAG